MEEVKKALLLADLRSLLAKDFEYLIGQYGDNPEVRLAIGNFTFGYLGLSYGLHAN
ncbi:MAG: hypothetical protein PHD09_07050 [Candidatus Omnitrophica bacterium]|nr:hypothetical protein [Candidatus Omnitrophota bacterium]